MEHEEEINHRRVRRIAREHQCTVPQVNAALDQHPILRERDKYLARTLALELVELDFLHFRGGAMRTGLQDHCYS